MKNKNPYEVPCIFIVSLADADVITASYGDALPFLPISPDEDGTSENEL